MFIKHRDPKALHCSSPQQIRNRPFLLWPPHLPILGSNCPGAFSSQAPVLYSRCYFSSISGDVWSFSFPSSCVCCENLVRTLQKHLLGQEPLFLRPVWISGGLSRLASVGTFNLYESLFMTHVRVKTILPKIMSSTFSLSCFYEGGLYIPQASPELYVDEACLEHLVLCLHLL